MMILKILVVVSFIVFLKLAILRALTARLKGNNVGGQAPINRHAFGLAKITAFIAMASPVLKAAGFSFEIWEGNGITSWTGGVIYILGMAVSLFALYELNMEALKFGLPKNETKLQTSGLFAVSRNPIYMSFLIIFTGACIHTLCPFTMACALISAFIHHRIILSEEKFLAVRFGKDWQSYAGRVRRYF